MVIGDLLLLIEYYGSGGLKVMGRDETANKEREKRGSRAIVGFEGQDKEFVLYKIWECIASQ